MLTKKKLILILLFSFLFSASLSFLVLGAEEAIAAEKFKNPEEFSQYIYENYSQKNFAVVYDNFAAELKRELDLAEYINFQKQNFEKYNLEYSNIKIGKAKKIDYQRIKEKFSYARDFGDYYHLEVSYLLKFDRFGHREKNSTKKIYLRKIKDDFQVFWDQEKAFASSENKAGEDKDD